MHKSTLFCVALVAVLYVKTATAQSDIEGATYIGCYIDRGTRDLEGQWFNHGSMTVDMCRAFCQAQNAQFMGVQHSSYCFCGSDYNAYGEASNCDMTCVGDRSEICGGVWANSVYSIDNPGQVPDSEYIDCYRDSGTRDLEGIYYNHGSMSVGLCNSLCVSQNYAFAGVQAATWCFCGNSYGSLGTATNCDMNCGGNANEKCGGGWANNVYKVGEPPAPEDQNFPGAFYVGCYKDTGTRDLGDHYMENSAMTLNLCLSFCQALGSEYFGVQASTWCFCGDSYGSFGTADNCNQKCGGLHIETCGGGWANNVYQIQQPDRVPESEEIGCYTDAGNRDLSGPYFNNVAMSVNLCSSLCGKLQYQYFGVQASSWCFCGDSYGSLGEATNCNQNCAGDAKDTCGGGWANNVYEIGSGFIGGDADTACQVATDELEAENARLAAELADVKQKLEEATTYEPPPMPTADPTAAISETAHEFTVSATGISYILETTPKHVALDADEFCEQYGMKLAPIQDEITLDALKLQLSSLNLGPTVSEVAVGQRSSVNLNIDVGMDDFNAAGWNCVTFVPDGDSYKLVGKKCQGERAILCAAIPMYC